MYASIYSFSGVKFNKITEEEAKDYGAGLYNEHYRINVYTRGVDDKREDLDIIIGKNTYGKPKSYFDVISFNTPKSSVNSSIRKFKHI